MGDTDSCLEKSPKRGGCKFHTCSSLSSATQSSAEAFRKASESQKPKISVFRTSESNPVKHTLAHSGLYYKVESEEYNRYMKAGQHEKLHKMGIAFNEHCVMVREPALEIFECIRATDLSLPAIRYIIYGQLGAGKSVTLAHVMSFCGRLGWFVVHVPWFERFMKYPKEVQVSSHNKDRVDTPVECAEWLNYFKEMNAHLIPEVKLQHTYVWNRRESTEAGASLSELLEYGASRSKYAADVMGAVLKELRVQSSKGILKTLVALDGVNALWLPSKISRIDNRNLKYKPDELTVVHNLKKMLTNDWSGGAIMSIVDTRCSPVDQKESYMPRYLLTKEAIDMLEPHIPIHIQNYSDKEAQSCLEYFIDRKWIMKQEGLTMEGQREILFLSSQNPLEMYNVCSRW
ncbi:hypothetical protein LSH36_248g02005 [Paralvinella palmiformis]|uniref:Small ribosomal subunit protein mS29 n=1 Tax=Paralvinella palmiformis TaxID=53620 RepID=A0AAD9N398_9ANNE|nr:hypothetical protein LSH36_248g02005 [Paralvinella palmiformis]